MQKDEKATSEFKDDFTMMAVARENLAQESIAGDNEEEEKDVRRTMSGDGAPCETRPCPTTADNSSHPSGLSVITSVTPSTPAPGNDTSPVFYLREESEDDSRPVFASSPLGASRNSGVTGADVPRPVSEGMLLNMEVFFTRSICHRSLSGCLMGYGEGSGQLGDVWTRLGLPHVTGSVGRQGMSSARRAASRLTGDRLPSSSDARLVVRDRSCSAPSVLERSLQERLFGQELRRVSDEFFMSYQQPTMPANSTAPTTTTSTSRMRNGQRPLSIPGADHHHVTAVHLVAQFILNQLRAHGINDQQTSDDQQRRHSGRLDSQTDGQYLSDDQQD